MSKFEKALIRLQSIPKDYTYDELRYVLEHLGFTECQKGKTSGSSVSFLRKSDNKIFMFHKPHPGNIVKPCYVKKLYELLKDIGEV